MSPAFPYRDVPDSPLARWDARWKLSAVLAAAFGVAVLDHLAPSLTALIAGLLLLAAARLPRRWITRRLILLGTAAVPFVIVLPFTLDCDGPGWNVGLIHVSEHGVVAGLTVFCRCLAIGCLGLVLLGTAPMHHLLAAAHRLWAPGAIVLIVGLAYRYAFLLGDEMRRIRIALRTRGFHARANRHGYSTLAHVTGAMLVRGADRAERVTAAMRCRGFDGRFRSAHLFRTRAIDLMGWLLMVGGITGLIAWDWLG